MKFKENIFYDGLKRILESDNLKFQIERKIPEMSIFADFFIYSDIPTIIEFIKISNIRKSVLISKLISYKLVNEGFIRLIPIFYVTSPRYIEMLKRLEEDHTIQSIADEIIILDREVLSDNDFVFTSEEINKIKIAIKKEVKKNEIIQKIVKLSDKKYSIDRIYYTLENLNSFPSRDSLFLSFYFHFFENETKIRLKEIFISESNEWLSHNNEYTRKFLGNFYIQNPPEEFDKYFITGGWNFNNNEFQAILFKFQRIFEKKLKSNKYYFMQGSFSDIFLRRYYHIKEQLNNRIDYFKNILRSNSYNQLDNDLMIYLMNYCLRNSYFKDYLPLNNLYIKNERFQYYQTFSFNNETIIVKILNLQNRAESFLSLNQFGKYIRASFSDKVLLVLFVSDVSREIFSDNKNKKKKLLSLEENGWKTYPFQDYNNNILILNKIFEEASTDEI